MGDHIGNHIWVTIYGKSYNYCLDNHIWDSYVDYVYVTPYMDNHIWVRTQPLHRQPYMGIICRYKNHIWESYVDTRTIYDAPYMKNVTHVWFIIYGATNHIWLAIYGFMGPVYKQTIYGPRIS